MDLMIKYRNDRKTEGATLAELRIYDGKIQALMSDSERIQKKSALDMELVIYRRQRQAEGASLVELVAIDAAIQTQFGDSPALVGDIMVRRMPPHENLYVSIDFNNATVGDLYNRVAAALGVDPYRMRLILRGRHIENVDASLRFHHINPGDSVGFCMKLGCNGNCCDMFYGTMCDANQRLAADMFKGHSADDVRHIYALTALSKTIVAEQKMVAPQVPASAPAPAQQQQAPVSHVKLMNAKVFPHWAKTAPASAPAPQVTASAAAPQVTAQQRQVPVSQVKLMNTEAFLNWAKTGLNNSAFNAILSEKCVDMLHECAERPESPVPPPPTHTPDEEKQKQSQSQNQKKQLEVEDLYG
jgi:hypothetical protein